MRAGELYYNCILPSAFEGTKKLREEQLFVCNVLHYDNAALHRPSKRYGVF